VAPNDPRLAERLGLLRMRRVLVVSVDGQAAADPSWSNSRTVSSVRQIFRAVSGTKIDQYNFETFLFAQSAIRTFVNDLRRSRCASAPTIDDHPCDDVQAFFAHVSLADISDPATRQRLESIRTGLTIDDQDIDLLVDMGMKGVENSPEIRQFLDSLESVRGKAPPS
jgi:NTE family protein